jgi:hypothetical protein
MRAFEMELHDLRVILDERRQVRVERARLEPGVLTVLPSPGPVAHDLGEVLAGRGLAQVAGGSTTCEVENLLSMTPEERIRHGLFAPVPRPAALTQAREFIELLKEVNRIRVLQDRLKVPTLTALLRTGMDGIFDEIVPRAVRDDDGVHSVILQALLADSPLTVLSLGQPLGERARVTLARLAHRTRERDASLLVMGVVADLEDVLGDHRSCAPLVVTEGLLQAI